MITNLLLILAGFVLLIIGADFLVKGSVGIANKLKIPALIVGLTIVAFGTSTPEFVVSINSALKGAAGIALGNAVGSNIANILLILGATAIVCPIVIKRIPFMRDFGFLMIVNCVFISFCLLGVISFWMGIIFLLMLFGFIYYNYRNAKASGEDTNDEETQSPIADKSWFFVTFIMLVGLAGIIYGADLLVDASVSLARVFGISEEIIGLTIIAFGTSLPELATSVVAALRKQSDLAIGNVIGSNIWNLLFIIGAAASITDIEVSKQFMNYDIWIMLLSTGLLLPIVWKTNLISRSAGVAFVTLYIGYLISQILLSQGVLSL